MTTQDKDMILGALDSLGVALADHDHEWTEGERAIYEAAVECVQKVERAEMAKSSIWLACQDCGERPRHFAFYDAIMDKQCWIVRPQRRSKCKQYKPGGSNTCQMVNYNSEEDARKEWNERLTPPSRQSL